MRLFTLLPLFARLFVFIMLTIAGPALAQTPGWSAAAIGSSLQSAGASSFAATAVDNAGNIFVVGGFGGTIALGNNLLISRGGGDIFVAKFIPSTATWAWAQSAGGTSDESGRGIAVNTVAGVTSVYITGTIANNSANTKNVLFGTVGATPGTVPQSGTSVATSSDLVVAKYVDNGSSATAVWTQVGGGGYTDSGNGIAVSTAGGITSIFVTGTTLNNSANASRVLFGGVGLTPGTMVQTGASTVIDYDVVLAKYTDNGSSATIQWTQVAGGTGSDMGNGIAVSGTSVFVAGYITNNAANTNAVLFGGSGTTPGTMSQLGVSPAAGQDLMVAKYTDNGTSATVGWTQVAGGTGDDIGNAIAVSTVLGTTKVYATGAITNNTTNINSVLFGGSGQLTGTVPQYGASSVSSQDLVVAQYTDNGPNASLGWTQVGGGTGQYETGSAIAVSTAGIYVSGRISNDFTNTQRVAFGGSGTTAGTVTQIGSSEAPFLDLVVAKYTDNGTSATLGWTQVGGGSAGDCGTGIAVSPTGVYVAGYVGNGGPSGVVLFGSATGSPLLGTTVTRAIIGQLVDSGAAGTWQTLVASPTGGSSTSLATAADAVGNVFVTGNFYGQVLFGNTLLSSMGSSDLFVAKYVPSTNTWAWAQRAGGTSDDQGNSIAVRTVAGVTSIFVTGFIINDQANTNAVFFGGTGNVQGSVPQAGTSAAASQDFVVAKYTDNGSTATVNWTQVGGGAGADQGNGIAASGNGVFITGTINNNLANANGVVLGGTGLTPGTVAQAGTTTSRVNNNLLVAKYTDNGTNATVSWTQVAGTSLDAKGRGIAVNGSGVYVAGSFANDLANTATGLFGGTGLTPGTVVQAGASTSAGYNDIVVAKYTDNGSTATVDWTQIGGGRYSDEGNSIAVNGNNVYVTGHITNTTTDANGVHFGGAGTTPGTLSQAGASTVSSQDLVVAKYTDNGTSATVNWTQVGGGTSNDAGNSIAVSGNHAIVTGTINNFNSNVNGVVFGGTGTSLGTVTVTGAGADDIVVAKYTDTGATGTLRWVQTAGGPLVDRGQGVAISGGNAFVVGAITETASFGGITLSVPAGIYAHVLGRINDPTLLAVKQALIPAATGELFLFPNPTHDIVQMLLLGPAAQAPLQLFDTLGRLRLTRAVPVVGTVTELSLANLPAGVYLLRCGTLYQRMVVE